MKNIVRGEDDIRRGLIGNVGGKGRLATLLTYLKIVLLLFILVFHFMQSDGAFLKEPEARFFGAVFPDTAQEYVREILTQIETSIDAKGDRLIVRDCGTDVELQSQEIMELADSGIETLFVFPVCENGLEDALKDCAGRGIRIVLVGNSCRGDNYGWAVVTSQNDTAGETLGRYVSVETQNARILLLGRAENAACRTQIEGFREGLLSGSTEKNPPEIVREILLPDAGQEAAAAEQADVDPEAADDSYLDAGREMFRTGIGLQDRSREMAMDLVRRQLHRGRDFDLIFATDGSLAAGAYAALEEAGEADSVRIVAVDGSPVGRRMLRESKYLATIMEYPSLIAGEAVEQAYSSKAGGHSIRVQVKLLTKNIIYSYDMDKWE
ncbi:MAG: substrate-binding domain-containing protein [Eubacteriales bacterium]|nr:substrate-binding domain-containing protein [Eubacteriales bacterium]